MTLFAIGIATGGPPDIKEKIHVRTGPSCILSNSYMHIISKHYARGTQCLYT